jgi:hypothetical protein
VYLVYVPQSKMLENNVSTLFFYFFGGGEVTLFSNCSKIYQPPLLCNRQQMASEAYDIVCDMAI